MDNLIIIVIRVQLIYTNTTKKTRLKKPLTRTTSAKVVTLKPNRAGKKKGKRSLFLRAPYPHFSLAHPLAAATPLFLPRAVILTESQTPPHLRRSRRCRHRQGRVPPPTLWTRVSLRPSPTQQRLHQQQKSQCISTSVGAQIHI